VGSQRLNQLNPSFFALAARSLPLPFLLCRCRSFFAVAFLLCPRRSFFAVAVLVVIPEGDLLLSSAFAFPAISLRKKSDRERGITSDLPPRAHIHPISGLSER
jgi:hypothetical protein